MKGDAKQISRPGTRRFSRRTFLAGGLAALGAASVVTDIIVSEDHNTLQIVPEEIVIKIAGLPREFENYRIGFLTDIHLGIFLPDEVLDHAVTILNHLRPDICLLGGDYLLVPDALVETSLWPIRNRSFSDLRSSDLPDRIYRAAAQVLSQVRVTDGTYGVLGNHDNWISPTSCVQHFTEHHLQIITNQLVPLRRGSAQIELLGLDDYWTGIPRIPLGVAKKSHTTRIVLTHNSDLVSKLLDEDTIEFQLALCGHTHGGQLILPYVGALHYNVTDTRLAVGLNSISDTQVYTARGIGVVGIPYRLNCPPEVTVLELRRA